MERLTHEADFGLEDWEETLFSVPSDPNGAYNILDIARYQGEPEFDEILKRIALRLSEIENVLGDDYNLSLILDLVEAERDGRIIVMKYAEREGVARMKELVEADRDGRCKIFPFDIGDVVYTNLSVQGDRNRKSDRPYAVKVVYIGIGDGKTYFHVEYQNGRCFPFDMDQIGKIVFLTREEAEAALKGEQDG